MAVFGCVASGKPGEIPVATNGRHDIYIIPIAKGRVFTKLDLTNENMHACS